MLNIFNKTAITRNQRFQKALILSIGLTVIFLLAFILIVNLFHFLPRLLYFAAAFCIAYVVSNYGRGVQLRFSVLAAVCVLVLIVVCDLYIVGFDFGYFLSDHLSFDFSTISLDLIEIFSIYYAFTNSRVVR
ncbi:MAG: hypothetical protein ACI4WG_01680 [Erysipelotrichaceae bacterium]